MPGQVLIHQQSKEEIRKEWMAKVTLTEPIKSRMGFV
jgi:hypothetical protein